MNQPQIIAHYRIIKHLGTGGFGDTFLVEDIHLPSSKVFVLKQLKPINDNSQIYELVKDRFHREAVILEELGNSHEQIPSLKAYFEENGLFYLVQEYIEGETLASLVQKQGKQSESTVRSLLSQTLEILEFIQNKKIIHRDIKPDNIIIRKSDNKPILIDFGAVKETMGTVISSSGNSSSSIIIGTPGFMPSEQGIGRPVFSSDLYALGLTAIYLLTGKTPQYFNTDPLTGEIIWQDENLSLSPNLIKVLNQSIKSHSQDRFATAKEMKLALTPPNYINPLPTEISSFPSCTPTSPTVSNQTSPPKNKNIHWLWLSLGCLGCLGLLATIFLFIFPEFLGSNNNPIQSERNPQVTEENPNINNDNLPSSIGWIRIGAVNNKSGKVSVGESLIPTTQPVIIAPLVVPAIGDKVTTIGNGVNLRDTFPKPPDYRLGRAMSSIAPGQQLIIVKIESFVDYTVSSNYTVVWAEVGLP